MELYSSVSALHNQDKLLAFDTFLNFLPNSINEKTLSCNEIFMAVLQNFNKNHLTLNNNKK